MAKKQNPAIVPAANVAEEPKLTPAQIAQNNAHTLLEITKAAFESKDMDAYACAMSNLTAGVDEWVEELKAEAYAEMMATEEPLKTAIRTMYVPRPRVKELKDVTTKELTDVVILVPFDLHQSGFVVDKQAVARIDIKDYCEKANLDTVWLTDCAKLLTLLQLRKTDIYALKASELAAQSYFFVNAVRQMKEGETPCSNTKICALLQAIVDATIYEDVDGHNRFRVTHRDIAFVIDCAHRFDPKQKAGVVSLKPRAFQTVMVSVLYSILTGEAYTVKNLGQKQH